MCSKDRASCAAAGPEGKSFVLFAQADFHNRDIERCSFRMLLQFFELRKHLECILLVSRACVRVSKSAPHFVPAVARFYGSLVQNGCTIAAFPRLLRLGDEEWVPCDYFL